MLHWLNNWRRRHQHPASVVLHAIAIPMLPLAGVLVLIQLIEGAWGLWWRPGVLIVVSYLLQWIGHRIEGNDPGELILLKKLLGKPYVAVSPRTPASPLAAKGDPTGKAEQRTGKGSDKEPNGLRA